MNKMSKCLFCSSEQIRCCFQASDRWHEVPGVYEMYRCDACGLLFLNPQPSPEQLAAHYPRTYYAFGGDKPDARRDEELYRIFYGANSSFLKKLVSLPYRPVLRTFVGGPGQRILDVGCGSGHFLAIAKKLCQMEVHGVEPYSYDVAFAAEHGLDIFNGTLAEAAFPNAYFDGITLNHVFEHLADPRAALLELKRILKPGGTLVIGVPQSSCLLYWIFGKRWWQLDVPRHLSVPSAKNLRAVAESTGFRVKRIRYNSIPSSILATLFYWRNDLESRKRYFYQFQQSTLGFRALLPVSYLLNLLRIADQMEMILTI